MIEIKILLMVELGYFLNQVKIVIWIEEVKEGQEDYLEEEI